MFRTARKTRYTVARMQSRKGKYSVVTSYQPIPESRDQYLRTLNALPSLVEAGQDVRSIVKQLSDGRAIRESGLLPFELYGAWKILDGMDCESFGMRRRAAKVKSALTEAMSLACENAGTLEGRTAVIVDTSRAKEQERDSPLSLSSCDGVAVFVATLIRISETGWVCTTCAPPRPLLFCGCNVVKDAASIAFTGASVDVSAGFGLLESVGFDADRVVVVSGSGELDPLTVEVAWNGHIGNTNRNARCYVVDLSACPKSAIPSPSISVLTEEPENALYNICRLEREAGKR